MEIVMNEYDWAESAIRRYDIGTRPYTTLRRVAGYYYENKYSKSDIRNMIERFLLVCDPSANIPKWSDTLDRIANGVEKRPLSMVDSISITRPEIEKIGSIYDTYGNPFKSKRKVAFTLLCLAKLGDASFDKNNHWVKCPDSDLIKMSNVSMRSKDLNIMIGDMIDEGFLRNGWRVDNTGLQVLFVEDGEEEIVISDMRNLGNRYMMYCGEPYFECVNCGLVVKRQSGNKQSMFNSSANKKIYCDSCASIIKTKQNVNSVMRIRESMQK